MEEKDSFILDFLPLFIFLYIIRVLTSESIIWLLVSWRHKTQVANVSVAIVLTQLFLYIPAVSLEGLTEKREVLFFTESVLTWLVRGPMSQRGPVLFDV